MNPLAGFGGSSAQNSSETHIYVLGIVPPIVVDVSVQTKSSPECCIRESDIVSGISTVAPRIALNVSVQTRSNLNVACKIHIVFSISTVAVAPHCTGRFNAQQMQL